jgi:hypothetical protein
MHNPRSGLEERALRGAGRGSLLRAELQQLQQPGILRPQPRQLSRNRHRNLTHDDTLATNDYALNADRRPRMTATIKTVTAVLALSGEKIRRVSRTDRGVCRKSAARRPVPGRSGSEVGVELGSPLLEFGQFCPQAPDLAVDVL